MPVGRPSTAADGIYIIGGSEAVRSRRAKGGTLGVLKGSNQSLRALG